MPVTTVDVPLTEEQDAFVSAKAQSEGYNSPAAFIQNVVEKARLNEAYEAEIDAKILEALDSERPGIIVTPEYWQEKRARLQARLKQARQSTK